MNALHFLSENFALIAEKKEGCLEKEGETMREKLKAFRFHYEHCPLFFSAVYAVHFLHNNSLCLNMLASRSCTILNGPCIRVMVIQ